MTGPVTADNLLEHLVAFADRELDDAQTATLWAYLAEHPNRTDALNWLATQQRLSSAARTTIGGVKADAALRGRIASLVNADARRSQASPRRRGVASFSLAAAAGIAIGLGSAAMLWRAPTAGAAVVPMQLIIDEGRVHAECSRLPTDEHDATLEAVDATLAARVRADFNGADAPDLSAADFAFVGAGPCPASKFNTVHLLYRSKRPHSLAAVSLFVQSDGGQFPGLKAGQAFRVSGPNATFPTVAWRSGHAIYFLVGDNEQIEADALNVLQPKSAITSRP